MPAEMPNHRFNLENAITGLSSGRRVIFQHRFMTFLPRRSTHCECQIHNNLADSNYTFSQGQIRRVNNELAGSVEEKATFDLTKKNYQLIQRQYYSYFGELVCNDYYSY